MEYNHSNFAIIANGTNISIFKVDLSHTSSMKPILTDITLNICSIRIRRSVASASFLPMFGSRSQGVCRFIENSP